MSEAFCSMRSSEASSREREDWSVAPAIATTRAGGNKIGSDVRVGFDAHQLNKWENNFLKVLSPLSYYWPLSFLHNFFFIRAPHKWCLTLLQTKKISAHFRLWSLIFPGITSTLWKVQGLEWVHAYPLHIPSHILRQERCWPKINRGSSWILRPSAISSSDAQKKRATNLATTPPIVASETSFHQF